MVSRDHFVQTVLKYEGTPFHHQGRVPGVGLDCPGPLIVGNWECSLKPRSFDVKGYGRVPDGVTLRRVCEEHMQSLDSLDDVREGDVILSAFRGGPPQHLGILVDATPSRRYWLQAEGYIYKRVRVTRLVFGERFLRFVAAYRVPGVV